MAAEAQQSSEPPFHILVVEDELPMQLGLRDLLVFHGYSVELAGDGNKGLQLGSKGNFDLAIIDLMLPGTDGLTICEELRGKFPDLAIIILTARSREEDAVTGLMRGADDYIKKPFSASELVLRVRALLRRTKGWRLQHNRIRIGNLTVDLSTRELLAHQIPASQQADPITVDRLSPREVEVLKFLRTNSYRSVSRGELLSEVWGYSQVGRFDTRTVDIHIAKLRRKIEVDPADPKHLLTVRGSGYRLVA